MTRFDASFGEEKNVRRRPAFPFLSLLLFQRVLCFSLLSSCFCAIRSVLSKTLKKKDEFVQKKSSFVRSFVPRKTLQKFLLSFPSRCGVRSLFLRTKNDRKAEGEEARLPLSFRISRGRRDKEKRRARAESEKNG